MTLIEAARADIGKKEKPGNLVHGVKLSDEEIIDIKRLRNKGGMKLNSIAKLYSISFQHVSSICLYGGV